MVRRTAKGSRVASTADMRQPVQSRAQATIDRICAASLEILTEGGWDAFNTNVVAARAGVSGPTVYRYFPNKYVLAAELRRRQDEAEADAVLPTLARIGDAADVSDPVWEWVELTARLRTSMPAATLLRAIAASIPDLQEPAPAPDAVVTTLSEGLQRRHPTLAPDEAVERARAIRTSVDSLIDDAVLEGGVTSQRISLIVGLAATLIRSASPTRARSLSGHAEN